MISARLHGYAVKSVFQGLVHAVLETSAFGTKRTTASGLALSAA